MQKTKIPKRTYKNYTFFKKYLVNKHRRTGHKFLGGRCMFCPKINEKFPKIFALYKVGFGFAKFCR